MRIAVVGEQSYYNSIIRSDEKSLPVCCILLPKIQPWGREKRKKERNEVFQLKGQCRHMLNFIFGKDHISVTHTVLFHFFFLGVFQNLIYHTAFQFGYLLAKWASCSTYSFFFFFFCWDNLDAIANFLQVCVEMSILETHFLSTIN